VTVAEARSRLEVWASTKQDLLFNPGLLCPGCGDSVGPTYTNLYATARRVLQGADVPEQEILSAAITIEHIDTDVP
jgi:hypothetical protein